jgi:hypothetical protein
MAVAGVELMVAALLITDAMVVAAAVAGACLTQEPAAQAVKAAMAAMLQLAATRI